ncbi:glycosyltransferase [Cohnella pontilimi]|uniref:Glycosyltransferase n=1 Tax=Cohnella pontilimi TaxID=2564100 RepID=A0A4V5LSS5_9BACL|nr:glycosyltransferase [Cohnella pontilimi]TJY44069.1 glycosyltransferase [Cohnella pontilimi]
MSHDPCIVIIYSTFGDGHVQAAKAIRQTLASRGVKRIHMIDLLAEAHPYWNALSRFTYLKSTVYFPKLYGWSYRVTNRANPDPKLSRLFHSIGKRKMKQVIEELRPDAVIHTFPYLAMSEMCGEKGIGIPTFTVLTDYVLHSRWVHPHTDRYFVATEQLKQALTDAGIGENRIAVSGIPIRNAFGKPMDKQALSAKYGLNPENRYVLISAGAYGVLSDVRKMVQGVLENTGFHVLLVCGKNRKLLQEMQTAYEGENRIRVMGFVEQMEELMAVSSCLLTKAGGITLTEALSASLPVIVYRPLPGQEEGNADVLRSQSALYTAHDLAELKERLRQLEHESGRRRMERAMKAVYRPNAAESIVADVLMIMEQYSYRKRKYAVPAERQAAHAHGYY